MKKQILKNQRGQTLIEYLIIVAIVGVGSIALMRAVGQNINTRFATVVTALGGKVTGNKTAEDVTASMYKRRDLKNFVGGAVGSGKKKDSENDSQDSDLSE